MLIYTKEIVSLLFVFILAVVLFKMYPQISQIVNWIVGFKHFSKTKDGFTLGHDDETKLPAGAYKSDKPEIENISQEEKLHVESEAVEEGLEVSWLEHFINGDWDDSISAIEAELLKPENDDHIVTLKGFLGVAKSKLDFENGVSYLEQVIDQHPDKEFPYNQLARIFLKKERYDDCITTIDRGVKRLSQHDYLELIRAECMENLGRYDEAIETINNTINQGKEKPAYYTTLARIFARSDKDAGELCFERGLKAFPENKNMLTSYAETLMDNGKSKEALHKYLILTDIDPGNPQHQGYLGNVYLDLDLTDKALEAYEQANKISDGSLAWIIANIGNLYLHQGLYTKAIEYLKEALILDPDSEYAHLRLSATIKSKTEKDNEEKTLREEGRLASIQKSTIPPTTQSEQRSTGVASIPSVNALQTTSNKNGKQQES